MAVSYLAKYDSSGLPELRSNSGVARYLCTEESKRSSGVVHEIVSGDVVLDEYRNATRYVVR